MPVATDVATLPDELANATTIFELWELTARAQAAAAQSTGDLKTSVDDVKAAITTAGQNAVAATDDLKAAVTTAGQNAVAATGDLRAAVTTAGQNAVAATGDLRAAVTTAGQNAVAATGDLKAAVTTGSQQVGIAIHDVRDEAKNLTTSVGELRTAVSHGAERVAGAIYDLISELQQRGLIGKREPTAGAPEPGAREYEFFKIIALEKANDPTRAHLGQLGQTVDEAIRSEKLAAFLEHVRRWEDLSSSPNQKRRRAK
jgi:hypothetical protein